MLLGAGTVAADVVWHLLGSTSVAASPADATASEHEELRLPSARGPFVSLRLQADSGIVRLDRVVITYAHGGKQSVDLKKKVLQPAGFTAEIRVNGNDHVIRKIDFWYRAPKFANVRLYAR
jgi:hypothetical protein